MDTPSSQPQPEVKPSSLPISFAGGLSSSDVALPHYRRSKILLTVLAILLLVLLLGAAVAFGQRFSVQSLRSLLPAAVSSGEYAAPTPLPSSAPLAVPPDISLGDSLEDIESDISHTSLGDLDAAIEDLGAQASAAE